MKKLSEFLKVLLTSTIILLGVLLIYQHNCIFGVVLLVYGALFQFLSKLIKNKDQKFNADRELIALLSLPFCLIIVMVFIKYFNANNDEDIKLLTQVIIYLDYTLILFLFKNENRNKMYITFGLFYIICVILSYIKDYMSCNDCVIFVNTLNEISDYNQIKNTLLFLIEAIVMPLKESVLTYIIFDTIFSNSDKSKKDIEISDEKVNKEICEENKINTQDNKTEKFQVEVVDTATYEKYNYDIIIKKKG